MTKNKMQSMGGKAVRDKYGKEHYSEMGKKAHEKIMEKYGPDFYATLAKKGLEARQKRAQERKEAAVAEQEPEQTGIVTKIVKALTNSG